MCLYFLQIPWVFLLRTISVVFHVTDKIFLGFPWERVFFFSFFYAYYYVHISRKSPWMLLVRRQLMQVSMLPTKSPIVILESAALFFLLLFHHFLLFPTFLLITLFIFPSEFLGVISKVRINVVFRVIDRIFLSYPCERCVFLLLVFFSSFLVFYLWCISTLVRESCLVILKDSVFSFFLFFMFYTFYSFRII